MTEPGATRRFLPPLRAAPAALPPVLLAAYPLVSLFQHNQSEIAASVFWRNLAVAVVAAIALFLVFLALTRRPAAASVAASLVVVTFFYYGIVSRWGIRDAVLLPLWLVLLVVGLAAAVRARGALGNVMLVVGAFAVVLVVVPGFRALRYRIDNPPVSVNDPRLWPSTPQQASAGSTAPPDIFYVIPDDYARNDVLRRYFRFDNSAFTRQLGRRGFTFVNGVRSPYSKSELNMASAMNFDYLSRLPHILGGSSQDVLLVRKMVEDSRAARVLKSRGYRYTHIDSDNITFAADNPHISPLASPDNLTYEWLRDSVLRLVGGPIGFKDSATDERFRTSVRSAFDKLAATAGDPGPKLVVFHTLMPHDPYIFGPHGQPVTFPDTSDTGHSTKFGMRYYVRQLQFVNRELLRTVDTILAHSKRPPVIVIQADEGFEALPEDWGEAAVQDMRVKGVMALYVPDKPKPRLPNDFNTVNTWRVLFNRYFGTHYPMRRSVSYPELDAPYQFEPMHVR